LEWGGHWQPVAALNLRWAAFDQRRQRREFFGLNDIVARGAEVALEYEMTSRTRITLTGHFLDAHFDNAAPAEFGGGSLWNVYASGSGPDGQGNGLGFATTAARGRTISRWPLHSANVERRRTRLRMQTSPSHPIERWGGSMADPYGDVSGIVPHAPRSGIASGSRSLARWCGTPVRPRHSGHRYSPPGAWM
jgi:hypothetical protein